MSPDSPSNFGSSVNKFHFADPNQFGIQLPAYMNVTYGETPVMNAVETSTSSVLPQSDKMADKTECTTTDSKSEDLVTILDENSGAFIQVQKQQAPEDVVIILSDSELDKDDAEELSKNIKLVTENFSETRNDDCTDKHRRTSIFEVQL